MQRGTRNQGISTMFIFNSIYFYIDKFSCIEQASGFSSLQIVLSVVEIPIVFCCLNILMPLNFMLEVCYLNVFVLMIFVVETCCIAPINNQT